MLEICHLTLSIDVFIITKLTFNTVPFSNIAIPPSSTFQYLLNLQAEISMIGRAYMGEGLTLVWLNPLRNE